MKQLREFDPFPANLQTNRLPSQGEKYRCTCCGKNFPPSAFLNTVEGDYCTNCVRSHEYKIIPQSTVVDLTVKTYFE